jgi:glycine/D-amino acid oxidase-like deaminating enzyme
VTALAREGHGYCAQTEAGPVRAGRVVNAAGADAGRIAAMLGVDLPVTGYPIQVNVTEPAEPLVPHLVYFAGGMLTLKQAKNGSFLIGGGWPARWSPTAARAIINPDSVCANLATACRVVPRLASVRLLRTWPAIVNGTADWLPILGEVPGLPGFFITMFPWMGFTGGPIAALLTAQLVLGRELCVDVRAFLVGRYVGRAC